MGQRNEYLLVDKYLNDLGSTVQNVSPTGKTAVSILDVLKHVAYLLHGRVMSSEHFVGKYRVILGKSQAVELVNAYTSLVGYGLSESLSGLITRIKDAIRASSNTVSGDVVFDRTTSTLMFDVHNEIVNGLKTYWSQGVALRLLSASGMNANVTIDGNQTILDATIRKFSAPDLMTILTAAQQSGQVAGVRTMRQKDNCDLLTDLYFGRNGLNASLLEMFSQLDRQRNVLRSFRTDVISTPPSRYVDLPLRFEVYVCLDVVENGAADARTYAITPLDFQYVRFHLKNNSGDRINVQFAGNVINGAGVIEPYGTLIRGGTSATVTGLESLQKLTFSAKADIRTTTKAGDSMLIRTSNAVLHEDRSMSSWFNQIVNPVRPFLDIIASRMRHDRSFQLVIREMQPWVGEIVNQLVGDSLYESWLTPAEVIPLNRRVLYIYLLLFVVPSYLLDPTLLNSGSQTTPPYLGDYVTLANNLGAMY